MLKLLKNKKGQNTAEYAVLIGLIVAGLVTMQTYIKRGLQGIVKAETDELGTTDLSPTRTNTLQYEPYYVDSSFTTETRVDEEVITGTAKNPTRTDTKLEYSSGGQKILGSTEAK